MKDDLTISDVTLSILLCSLYTFDMRNLTSPLNVHNDHVSAVIDVDYSPTGKEFVSASYDKTVRIYDARQVRRKRTFEGLCLNKKIFM